MFIFRVKVVIVPPVARASRDPKPPCTSKARNTKIFAKKEFPERTNVGDARPAVSDARGLPDGIVR